MNDKLSKLDDSSLEQIAGGTGGTFSIVTPKFHIGDEVLCTHRPCTDIGWVSEISQDGDSVSYHVEFADDDGWYYEYELELFS